MRSDEWRKVEELLDAALELGLGERRRLLDEACAGAPELRREVEELLACEGPTDGFLDAPALALSADFFDDETPGEARAGQTIGRYRIVREIGRGGMGAVYLAERADGEFEQRVALKVVRRSFADTDLARRFRQERQILASLNHPNVARLLNGGVSSDGEPYLVMEYVEGARIDDYCDSRNLSTEERLRLFVEVCRGVSYAHQHLVVHRDIKPSNILVTPEGTPKLLDFGIAKLVLPQEEAGAGLTLTGAHAMTPDYASPEQVRGLPVTTATDVYSLGVLLYELLTGRRPYRLTTGTAAEVARAVCEEEPERPSRAAAQFGLEWGRGDGGTRGRGDGGKETAASDIAPSPHRPLSSSPPHHVSPSPKPATRNPKLLRGDLDNVVLMAMRKEPQRRYASVAQLAEDVRRHLEGRPVAARKDTLGYRASKFVRRNRVGVAAASLVLVALVAGIVATAWQARRARGEARVAAQERDRARTEAAKAERINEFLQSVFASANPSWYSSGFGQRGEVKVVDVLEQAGRRIDTDFKDQPEIRAELHHTIGTTYQALGKFESAKTHFRAAVDAYRGLYGERHPEVAEALYYLAASMEGSGDLPAAKPLFRQSLEMFREVDPDNVNVPYLLSDFSHVLNMTGETATAEQAAREGLELSRRRFGDEHVLTIQLLQNLGTIDQTRGDLGQAETFYQTALSIFNRMPNGRMLSSGVLSQLGRLAMWRGDLKQAEAQAREALDISRQVANETHPNNLGPLFLLAEVHYRQGAYADAEKEAASALDLLRRVEVLSRNNELMGLSLMSLIHAKTNRPASANAFLREALALSNSLPDEIKHHDEGLLGEALIEMKRGTEARALLSKRYEYHARKYGEQTPDAVRTRQLLDRLGAATPGH